MNCEIKLQSTSFNYIPSFQIVHDDQSHFDTLARQSALNDRCSKRCTVWRVTCAYLLVPSDDQDAEKDSQAVDSSATESQVGKIATVSGVCAEHQNHLWPLRCLSSKPSSVLDGRIWLTVIRSSGETVRRSQSTNGASSTSRKGLQKLLIVSHHSRCALPQYIIGLT